MPVCERLQQAGIPRANNRRLGPASTPTSMAAGFPVSSRKDRIRYIGNDAAGYETDLAIYGSVGKSPLHHPHPNLRRRRQPAGPQDHGIVGVTMALKNLFGAINNPTSTTPMPAILRRRCQHAPAQSARRSAVTICDPSAPQYERAFLICASGPWPFNGLIVSRDPVALDYTGWQIIEQKRAEKAPAVTECQARTGLHRHRRDPRHRLEQRPQPHRKGGDL